MYCKDCKRYFTALHGEQLWEFCDMDCFCEQIIADCDIECDWFEPLDSNNSTE